MKKRFKGFTLAEMMVVMLVLTVILAAAAPIMTKKRDVTASATDTPWKYADNNTDAYYGLQNNQTAMIGQDAKTDKDLSARLILTGNSDNPYITFKSNQATTLGNIFFKATNQIIAGPYDTEHPFVMTGFDNTALGYQALRANTDGYSNVAIGFKALSTNVNGANNIAIGPNAMLNNTSNNNIAIGLNAMKEKTIGHRNIAIGTGAMEKTHYTGAQQLSYEHITDNIAIGHNALNGLYGHIYSGATAIKNIAIGTDALSDTRNWGSTNIGIGHSALKTNIQGDSNVAIGTNAMYKNESGDENTALGYGALQNNTKGSGNTALGYLACNNVKGSNKTCIGANSGPYTTSPYQIQQSDLNSEDDTRKIIYLGDEDTTVIIKGNLVVGKYALLGVGGKEYYTSMRMGPYHDTSYDGSWAGQFGHWHSTGSDTYTFSDMEGFASYPCFNPLNNFVRVVECSGTYNLIGTNSNRFESKPVNLNYTHPYQTFGKPSSVQQGSSIWLKRPDGTVVGTDSDKRLKNIKGENKAGLEEVKKLNVFDFTYKKDDKKTPHVGVIAQDLRKIFPNAVVEGEDGYLQIRHEDMFYAVINAIKQLDKVIEALIAEVKVDLAKILKHDEDIAKLQKQNKEIVKQNKELQNKNEELEKRIDKLEKRLEKVLKELDED